MGKTKKRSGGARVFIAIVAVMLLAVLAYAGYHRFILNDDRGFGGGFLFGGGDRFPSDEEIASKGWISPEIIKRYAKEYNVGTEFLSRIFPGKIVYKQGGEILYEDTDPNLAKHPYDWGRLYWDGRRPYYGGESEEDGSRTEALFGVDVSRHQGEIDWKRAAADGVSFAMIRAGYRGYDTGRLLTDECFEQNMRGASDAGVKIGVYLFSQAVNETEAIEEAELVLANIAPYKVDFPVVFDIEEIGGQSARTDALSNEEITDIAIAFCERIGQAGYTPMIYANPKWFVSRMTLSELEPYDKWLAQYYRIPAYPYAFSIWQFTDSGAVDGINGNVDLNLAFVRNGEI
ncbi:MAG: Lyzozyme M1 (1,4-beta-N-acetylmuramidase) [Clostridiales Family XIII bacterium]|nr:Lyzozyme M1 (1,4-beta-N-acetylmuramidase) [Clostridiales Family XIII bacterium]